MGTMPNQHQVPEGIEDRLDVWLAGSMGISRSQVQRLIKQGVVLVNGKLPKKTGDTVEVGDVIEVGDAPTVELGTNGQEFEVEDIFRKIKVIADTPDYLVIEKPAGLVVHPPMSVDDIQLVKKSKSVAGWMLQNYPKCAGVGEYANRPGLVHRLDKDTSGLMVIAKNQASFIHLKQQFKSRDVTKNYYALTHGAIIADHGFLDFPIGRGDNGKMVARPKISSITLKNVGSLTPGRIALTEFTVLKRFVNYTLLDVLLHTGRTHQIRVHCFAYNHPLVGDPLYQQKYYEREMKKIKLGRVFLHAYRLEFTDVAGERKVFESPLPGELEKFLEEI